MSMRKYSGVMRITASGQNQPFRLVENHQFLLMGPYAQVKSAHIVAKDGPIRALLSCSTQVYWTILLDHNLVPEATLKGSQFLKGILRSTRPTLAGNRGGVAVKVCMVGLAVACVA